MLWKYSTYPDQYSFQPISSVTTSFCSTSDMENQRWKRLHCLHCFWLVSFSFQLSSKVSELNFAKKRQSKTSLMDKPNRNTGLTRIVSILIIKTYSKEGMCHFFLSMFSSYLSSFSSTTCASLLRDGQGFSSEGRGTQLSKKIPVQKKKSYKGSHGGKID